MSTADLYIVPGMELFWPVTNQFDCSSKENSPDISVKGVAPGGGSFVTGRNSPSSK